MLTKSDLIKELIYRDVYDLEILDVEDIYSSFRTMFIDGKTYSDAADTLACMISNGDFGASRKKSKESDSFF